jgi:hypothetical protein
MISFNNLKYILLLLLLVGLISSFMQRNNKTEEKEKFKDFEENADNFIGRFNDSLEKLEKVSSKLEKILLNKDYNDSESEEESDIESEEESEEESELKNEKKNNKKKKLKKENNKKVKENFSTEYQDDFSKDNHSRLNRVKHLNPQNPYKKGRYNLPDNHRKYYRNYSSEYNGNDYLLL